MWREGGKYSGNSGRPAGGAAGGGRGRGGRGPAVAYRTEEEGYGVRLAHNGVDGLRLARQGVADLILLDLELPGVRGLEVCKQLRQTSTVPIIILTSSPALDDRLQGLTLGADDYVAKPFDMLELLNRVAAVLRRARPTGRPDQSGESRG